MRLAHALATERTAGLSKSEVAEEAETLDGLAHGARDLGELAAGPLHARKRDETAQNFVGPFEHHRRACVTEETLVRSIARVAEAPRDLLRFVRHCPESLRPEHLADGAFERALSVEVVSRELSP